MAAVVVINDGRGFRVEAHRINQPSKSISYRCISYYCHFNIPFKQLYTSNKTKHFSYRGGCSMHGSRCIEGFKRRPGLG